MIDNALQVHEQLELLDVPSDLDVELLEDLIINAESYLEDVIITFIRERDPDYWWNIVAEITFQPDDDEWCLSAEEQVPYMDFIKGEWWDTYATEILYPHAKQYDDEDNLIALFGVTL